MKTMTVHERRICKQSCKTNLVGSRREIVLSCACTEIRMVFNKRGTEGQGLVKSKSERRGRGKEGFMIKIRKKDVKIGRKESKSSSGESQRCGERRWNKAKARTNRKSSLKPSIVIDVGHITQLRKSGFD